jgi:hypothetical protein
MLERSDEAVRLGGAREITTSYAKECRVNSEMLAVYCCARLEQAKVPGTESA